MIGVILITHGYFGQELLRTAEDIVGRQEQVAALSVTADTGVENLAGALVQAIERLQTAQGCLVLVDMLGGTPCNTALLQGKNQSIEIVTGVNLYMIVSAFTHRAQMDLRALAEKVAEDGKRAILLPKDLLMKRTA